jgi:hypothetical protein
VTQHFKILTKTITEIVILKTFLFTPLLHNMLRCLQRNDHDINARAAEINFHLAKQREDGSVKATAPTSCRPRRLSVSPVQSRKPSGLDFIR